MTCADSCGMDCGWRWSSPWPRAAGPGRGYMFQTIDVPGASSTQANGINDAGQIVGDYDDSAASTRLPGQRRGLHDHRRAGGQLTPLPRHQRRRPDRRELRRQPAASNTASCTAAGPSRPSTCRGPQITVPSASTTPARSSGPTLFGRHIRLPVQRRGPHDLRRAGGRGRLLGHRHQRRRPDRRALLGRRLARHGFLYSGGVFTTIACRGRPDPAIGINDAGQIVGS